MANGKTHWQSVIRVWSTDGDYYDYQYDSGDGRPVTSSPQVIVAKLRALADDIERYVKEKEGTDG